MFAAKVDSCEKYCLITENVLYSFGTAMKMFMDTLKSIICKILLRPGVLTDKSNVYLK